MKVAILVPRRVGQSQRDRVWAYVRRCWVSEHQRFALVEGHHDSGLFNRAAAINLAAQAAGAWDVALIADADCLADPEAVRNAVLTAAQRDVLVAPYEKWLALNEDMTDRVLNGYSGDWSAGVITEYPSCSAILAVSRPLWDRIGGFDVRFRGWGLEDLAFFDAATTFGGPLERLSGVVWHLWHPSARHDHPALSANQDLLSRYEAASGDTDAMAALVSEASA